MGTVVSPELRRSSEGVDVIMSAGGSSNERSSELAHDPPDSDSETGEATPNRSRELKGWAGSGGRTLVLGVRALLGGTQIGGGGTDLERGARGD